VQGEVLALAHRPLKGAPMATTSILTLTPENGVVEDYGSSLRRQVTILAESSWEMACKEVDEDLDWTSRRANVLVREIDLQSLVNTHVHLGTAIIEVLGEVDPCHVMDAAQQGLKKALKPDWRGGVYGKVIQSGEIRIGDTIHSSQ